MRLCYTNNYIILLLNLNLLCYPVTEVLMKITDKGLAVSFTMLRELKKDKRRQLSVLHLRKVVDSL